MEDVMAEFAKRQEDIGEAFVLKEFFDRLNAIGSIPISLGKWEMTGKFDLLD